MLWCLFKLAYANLRGNMPRWTKYAPISEPSPSAFSEFSETYTNLRIITLVTIPHYGLMDKGQCAFIRILYFMTSRIPDRNETKRTDWHSDGISISPATKKYFPQINLSVEQKLPWKWFTLVLNFTVSVLFYLFTSTTKKMNIEFPAF